LALAFFAAAAMLAAPPLPARADGPEGGPAPVALKELAWSWITAGQMKAAGVGKPRPPLEAAYPGWTEILAPVRDVLEAMGWRVEWNPEGFAYAVKDGRRIAVCAGECRGDGGVDWGFRVTSSPQ
jgi:hypothetical protein